MRKIKRIDNTKTAILLREAIRAQGMTQGVISSKTGLNQSQISRLLNGQFQRASKGLNALCILLSVKPIAQNAIIE